MPNLDPWKNQNEATTKLENDLLSIKAERQEMIHPKSHPTYNERHEKIIEMIDLILEKYIANKAKTQQQNEQITIDNIIEELDKKREKAIHKKKQALLKDEVWKYSEEEDTIDYVLFRIRELTGRLI
jgi:predicted metal-dependent hydrolase